MHFGGGVYRLGFARPKVYGGCQYEMKRRSGKLRIATPSGNVSRLWLRDTEGEWTSLHSATAGHGVAPPVQIARRSLPLERFISYWRPLYAMARYGTGTTRLTFRCSVPLSMSQSVFLIF